MCFNVGQTPRRQETDKVSYNRYVKIAKIILVVAIPMKMAVKVAHTTRKAKELGNCCNVRK